MERTRGCWTEEEEEDEEGKKPHPEDGNSVKLKYSVQ